MPWASSRKNSSPENASGGTPPLSPRPPSRSPSLSPRRASSLPVNDAKLSISTTIVNGTSTSAHGGAGGKEKYIGGISLTEEGYEAGRSPRSTRRTGTRLGRGRTAALLSLLGLLALAPLRGTFRASSPPSSSASRSSPAPASTSSPSRNSSMQPPPANQAILPTKVDLSLSQIDGVLTPPAAGDEGGAGAAAWAGGAASTRRTRSDQPIASVSSIGGGMGEGAARDGKPRCWTDEEGKSRCLPTVFFFGVSKCGTTSLSTWLAEHPRAVFAPPAKGHDFREAHVFDFSPKFWFEATPRARRELLSPVATPEDTVIDFTPNYSVVGEAPLRISDFYSVDGPQREGRLRRNLRFLVVLREPVARMVSSWEYKSEPGSPQLVFHQPNGTVLEGNTNASVNPSSTTTSKTGSIAEGDKGEGHSEAKGRRLPPQTATNTSKRVDMVERRPLSEAFREGAGRVERLAECARNATDTGLFGKEPIVTFCRATKGMKQCHGHPPCKVCNTHTEPWCNPRKYLEEPIFNAHVGKSMYALQLRRWFDVFGRENFKVVFTEDMQADPIKTLTEVLDFLGLDLLDPEGEKGLRNSDMWDAIVGARYNTADGAKKKALDPQVTPELRDEMRAFFAPHNRDLKELLGVPLPKTWSV